MKSMNIWLVTLLSVMLISSQTANGMVCLQVLDQQATSSVVLMIADSVGNKKVCDFTAYDGTRMSIGRPSFDSSDFKNVSRFCLLLQDRQNQIATLLVNTFDEDLRQEIAFHENGEPLEPAFVERIAGELNELLPGEILFDPARFPEVKTEAVRLGFPDMGSLPNSSENPLHAMTINRLLIEAAFPNEFSRSQPVGTSEDGRANLAPGIYWFVPNDHPGLIQRAEIKVGEAVEVVIEHSPSLWLDFALVWGKTTESHLFVPRSQSQMQYALRNLRFPGSKSDHFSIKSFLLRPNVTPSMLAESRQVALQALPELMTRIEIPKDTTNDAIIKLFAKRKANLDSCQKILAVAGQIQDADYIAKQLNLNCGIQELHLWAATIARIETRQHQASFGILKELLGHSDQRWKLAAGVQMHLAGLSEGDDEIRRFIINPPKLNMGYEATKALLDSENPQTLVAMRSYLKRCLTFFDENDAPGLLYITGPCCLYLLAYGDEADWRLVSRANFTNEGIFGLSFLAANPLNEAQFLMKSDRDLARRITLVFRDRQHGEAIRLQQQFLAELRKRYVAQFEGYYAIRAQLEMDEENSFFCSCILPTSGVVRKLGGFGPIQTRFEPQADYTPSLLQRTPWLPQPQFIDIYIQNWLNGHGRYLAQLDYLDPQSIEDAVQRLGNGTSPMVYPLYMMRHRIGTTAWSTSLDNFPMGKERRSYFFIHNSEPGNPGGLSGIAEVSFEFAPSGEMEIRIRLVQKTLYEGGAIFGQRVDEWSAWPHHKYVVNAGRDLIDNVEIRNVKQKVKAAFHSQDPDGVLIYHVKPPSTGSSDWYLDVNLKFVNQKKTLTYSLTYGENARRIRHLFDEMFSTISSSKESRK